MRYRVESLFRGDKNAKVSCPAGNLLISTRAFAVRFKNEPSRLAEFFARTSIAAKYFN
jgi:hypothetical protein